MADGKSSTVREARSHMRLKKSSNLIGQCDWLLQELVTFLPKFSRTFYESYQSNMAYATNV